MNYYFSYAIRCIIRRIIYFLIKPKYLLIIATSIIVIFLLSNYTSVFGWEGDNYYTDKNATIISAYDSIASDLVNRMQNSSSSLLDSYFNQRVYHIEFNIIDKKLLLAAQNKEQKYDNLIIRNGGIPVRYCELKEVEQDNLLDKTFHGSL